MLVTASEMQRIGPLAVDVVEAGLLQDVVHGLSRLLELGRVADLEVDDDHPAELGLARELLRIEDAELVAGDRGGEVVEDLDQAAPVVAVVALPAVGPDAEDVALVALRDEAELVADEVVGLRHRVAHERRTLESLARVGDEVLLRESGLQRADHDLDTVVAGSVAVHLQRSRRGARLIGHRHSTPSVVVVAPPPHVRRTSRSVASSVGALSPRKAAISSHTPSSVSRTAPL